MPARRHPASRWWVANHVAHHLRFYSAAAFGALVGLLCWDAHPAGRLMLAGDGFFLVYLVLVAIMGARLTPARMRHRASFEDAGIALVLVITVAAVGVSLASIFALLNDGTSVTGPELALSIVSVLLGWLTLHTVLAFHYAHLYYRQGKDAEGRLIDARGLEFPGTIEPTVTDLLYFAFVIGMTAQVSDVQIASGAMRKVALVHGMLSFLFNTVLLALAVNVAASLVR